MCIGGGGSGWVSMFMLSRERKVTEVAGYHVLHDCRWLQVQDLLQICPAGLSQGSLSVLELTAAEGGVSGPVSELLGLRPSGHVCTECCWCREKVHIVNAGPMLHPAHTHTMRALRRFALDPHMSHFTSGHAPGSFCLPCSYSTKNMFKTRSLIVWTMLSMFNPFMLRYGKSCSKNRSF